MNKHSRMSGLAACGLAVLGLAATPVVAQDEPVGPVAESSAWGEFSPTWSSEEIERLAEQMIGVWRTTEEVETAGGAAATIDVVLTFHPAPVEGVPDALYSEAYRADQPAEPYRQAVMQFYERSSGLHLRTFEIRKDETGIALLRGMGRVPEAFPELSREHLIATMDLKVQSSSGGFKAKSPYPYPTGAGGAVEMTSEMTLNGGVLAIADRGYGTDGEIVWGAGEEGVYRFAKVDDNVRVERKPSGLVILDFVRPDGDVVAENDTLHVHYDGWLRTGFRFDSSRERDRVFRFQYPPRLIEGWNAGLDEVTTGTRRKLIIPAVMGYGQRGQPQAKIPPNAPLYFDIEIMAVQSPAPPPDVTTEPAEAEGDDHEGHGHE